MARHTRSNPSGGAHAHDVTVRSHRKERRPLRYVLCAAAFVAAFLERWWFSSAWHESGSLTSAFYYGDASRLVEYAIAIAQGRLFDNGIPYHPPGWPLALAALFKLFGAGSSPDFTVPVAAVKVLLAGMQCRGDRDRDTPRVRGGGSCRDGRRCVSRPLPLRPRRRRNRGGYRGGVSDCASSLRCSRPFVPFGPIRGGRMAWAAFAGAVGGYAMLVRAEFMACSIGLVVAIVLARRDGWRSQVALFAGLYCLVLAPTTLWHWRSLAAFNASHVGRVAAPLPEFAPVTSVRTVQFRDGEPRERRRRAQPRSPDARALQRRDDRPARCRRARPGVSGGGRPVRARVSYRCGLAVDPSGRRRRTGRPQGPMASGFLAHGYLFENVGSTVDGIRRRVDLVDPDVRALLFVHLALLLGGIYLLRRDRTVLLILLSPLVALIASTVLFYGYVRLGTAYLPVLWVSRGRRLPRSSAHDRRPRRSRVDLSTRADTDDGSQRMVTIAVLLGDRRVADRHAAGRLARWSTYRRRGAGSGRNAQGGAPVIRQSGTFSLENLFRSLA